METIQDTSRIDANFEHIMKAHDVPDHEARWAGHLIPLLTGDALVAVDSLGSDMSVYEDVKTAILSHLGIAHRRQ